MNLKQLLLQQEEAFDKKFVRTQNDSGQFVNGKAVEWQYIDGKVDEIKSSNRSSSQAIIHSLMEEVEGMKTAKDHHYYAQPVRTPSHIDTRNKALSDVIAIIKEGIK